MFGGLMKLGKLTFNDVLATALWFGSKHNTTRKIEDESNTVLKVHVAEQRHLRPRKISEKSSATTRDESLIYFFMVWIHSGRADANGWFGWFGFIAVKTSCSYS